MPDLPCSPLRPTKQCCLGAQNHDANAYRVPPDFFEETGVCLVPHDNILEGHVADDEAAAVARRLYDQVSRHS